MSNYRPNQAGVFGVSSSIDGMVRHVLPEALRAFPKDSGTGLRFPKPPKYVK